MRRGLTRSYLNARRGAFAASSGLFTGRAVFEGDSLTFGYQNRVPYPTAFQNANPGCTIFNVSDVGDSVMNMIDQAPTEVDPKYVAGAVAIIWGGTNDLTGFTPAETYSSIQTWCQGRRNVGFRVVCCNLIKNSTINDANRLSLNSLLAAGHSFCDALVDLASTIDDWTNHPTWWDSDHVHLTTPGYQIVADLVGPVIRGL